MLFTRITANKKLIFSVKIYLRDMINYLSDLLKDAFAMLTADDVFSF